MDDPNLTSAVQCFTDTGLFAPLPNGIIPSSPGGAGVTEFNTRTGNVTLTAADVNGVGTITNPTTGNAGSASVLSGTSLLYPVFNSDGGGLAVQEGSPFYALIMAHGVPSGTLPGIMYAIAINIIGSPGTAIAPGTLIYQTSNGGTTWTAIL